MAVAAPVIAAEMADWVRLGGGNSGIVGDPNHTYGFHLAANQVPAGDYSRWRDPRGADGPYPDWNWACAGDFSHRGDEGLRAMHRRVLARLMAGELPMICEFIGQPWADRPVYYWARWNGALQRYTGAGHDLWSHISWYRSMADQRAYLWTEDDMALSDEDLYRIALVVRQGSDDRGFAPLRRQPKPVQDAIEHGSTKAVEERLTAKLDELAAKIGTGGVDVQALAATVAEQVRGDLLAEIREQIRDAVADLGEGGAAKVRADED